MRAYIPIVINTPKKELIEPQLKRYFSGEIDCLAGLTYALVKMPDGKSAPPVYETFLAALSYFERPRGYNGSRWILELETTPQEVIRFLA